MTTARIVYGSTGKRHFVDGKEVSEAQYHAAIPSRLDDMLQSGKAPFGMSDCVFLEGQGGCYDQFGTARSGIGDYYRKVAEEAGVNISGRVYKSGLAAYPGDPRAWVNSMADVQRVCEERGMGCEGAVKVKVRNDVKPMPAVAIADDIVDSTVAEIVAENPEAAHDKNLRDEVREAIKPHWADKQE